MNLHIFNEDEFPPLVDAWEGIFFEGDDILCYDSPLLHNFGEGDQIQVHFDDLLCVYEVIEVRPAHDVIPHAWCENMRLALAPDTLRLVTLRVLI